MKNQILLLTAFMACSETSFSQNLTSVLSSVRKNSYAYKSEQAKTRAAKEDVKALDVAYDWHLHFEGQMANDNSLSNNSFSGDERRQKLWSMGISKMFSSGTQVDLKYQNEWQNTKFPPPTPQTVLPDGTIVPGRDASSATRFNPAHTHTYSATLYQPLYKNFNSNSVRYQKDILTQSSEVPRYLSLIKLQADQYQAEAFYWNIAALNQNIAIMEKLLKKSKEFANRMKERVNLGRAENVDLADAEARVLTTESSLVDLSIARDDLVTKLTTLMYNSQPKKLPQFKTANVSRKELQLQQKFSAQAMQYAQQMRLDLRLNNIQQNIRKSQIQAAKEEGKWDVNLFATMEANGLNSDSSEASEEALKATNVLNAYGISVSIPIGGHSKSLAMMASHYHQKTALDIERQELLSQVRNDLNVAYIKKSGGEKKEKVLRKQITSLNRKRSAEFRKLKQARSEQVAVIRYEMEVLQAEADLVDALKNQRLAEAQIRHIMHAYSAKVP